MKGIRNLYRRFKMIANTHPHLVISRTGKGTVSPSVHLSARSTRGTHSICTRHDDNHGNAQVEMLGRAMARTLVMPLLDVRGKEPVTIDVE